MINTVLVYHRINISPKDRCSFCIKNLKTQRETEFGYNEMRKGEKCWFVPYCLHFYPKNVSEKGDYESCRNATTQYNKILWCFPYSASSSIIIINSLAFTRFYYDCFCCIISKESGVCMVHREKMDEDGMRVPPERTRITTTHRKKQHTWEYTK